MKRSRDHPRSRGEYAVEVGVADDDGGSSPLSRGIRGADSPRHRQRRIIPALAGNTDQSQWTWSTSKDHPRSRGEYATEPGCGVPGFGSSPLSRGILNTLSGAGATARIIPALAGNTFPLHITAYAIGDHPRSRGEYTARWLTLVYPGGSSPLSRGIHLLTRDFISWTCRILGTPSSHVSASRSHSPRVCGGRHPGEVSRLALRLKDLGGPSGLAPHNRLAPMDHPMSGRTYPAHSWRGTP